MKVYKISPILKYSPFFELTYVSRLDFKIGNIVEINFSNRNIFGIVMEIYSLKDAKVEIRKSDFFTKKIESKLEKKDLEKFDKKQFLALRNFSEEFGIPVGEIIFYLFGEGIDLQNNPFDKMLTDGNSDFNFEKYVLLTAPHISRLHLYFVWLENFTKNKQAKFKVNFLGVNEKYFLDNYKNKKIKIVLEENKYIAKKFLVNIKGDEIINKEVLDKITNNTFVFVLEQAYASRIFCKDCKKSYDCENCGHAYSVLHENGENFLYCKSCKNQKVLKKDQYLICKNCGSWQVFPFGNGVQRVKEFLTENGLEEKMKEKQILVGSVKDLNKFLKKNKVFEMVVVASLGPLVRGKNFDSDEKLIYLLSKLENISKEIYINKRDGDEISLQNYKDKEKFVKEELKFRKQAALPPFTKIVSLIFNYRNKKFVDKFLLQDIEKYKISGEIKKGSNYVYYWFLPSTLQGSEFCKALRNFGDVVISSSIVDQSISSKN